jgi:hypothetical protein
MIFMDTGAGLRTFGLGWFGWNPELIFSLSEDACSIALSQVSTSIALRFSSSLPENKLAA